VNDRVIVEPGAVAVWGTDSIRLDGGEIAGPSERLYLMLNKPFGYVCSLNDPEGRPIVTDLLKGVSERVYPVGRLDFDSLGLLLLSNDGEWAHRLTHPSFHVPKTYKVTVDGLLSEEALKRLRTGVHLEDGFSGPAKITLLRPEQARSILRLTVTAGRKRLVRRMIEAVGFKTLHLVRIGFGILELGDLKVGTYRPLDPEEVEGMKRVVGLL